MNRSTTIAPYRNSSFWMCLVLVLIISASNLLVNPLLIELCSEQIECPDGGEQNGDSKENIKKITLDDFLYQEFSKQLVASLSLNDLSLLLVCKSQLWAENHTPPPELA